VRPGSPIAFIKRRRLKAKGSIRNTLWGEQNSIKLSTPDLRYSRLDLRTCAEAEVRRFDDTASEFSWASAPDDLWVYPPDSHGRVQPVAGGPMIDISAELGAQPDWPPQNPEPPRDAVVGMSWRSTGLHVWDLERRALAQVPVPPGLEVRGIVMPQRGDRTLLAIARAKGEEVSHRLQVIAVAAPSPRGPASTARAVPVSLAGRAGPPRLRSLTGGNRLALVAKDTAGMAGTGTSELIVVDLTGGPAGYRIDLGYDPWAWTRSGRPWLVRATDPMAPTPNTAHCRSTATVLDLETGRSRPVPTAGCTTDVQMVEGAPFALLYGRYQAAASAAGPSGISRLLLDLERGTLTSLQDLTTTFQIVGQTAYFADTTHIMAIDLGAPARPRIAVTGLHGIRSMAVEPSSRRIAIVDGDQDILVFDIDKGQLARCH